MGHVPQFTADAAFERPTVRRAMTAARDERGIKRARSGPPPMAASYPTVGSVVLVASFGQAMPAAAADAVLESTSVVFADEETGLAEAHVDGDGSLMYDEETADAEGEVLVEPDDTDDEADDPEIEALVEPDDTDDEADDPEIEALVEPDDTGG